jgi:hypothetical protein
LPILYPRGKEKKTLLEAHHCSVVDIDPQPKRANEYGSSATVKSCTTTLKKVVYAVRVVTQKSKRKKYHEVNISCLYLIN